MTNRKLITAMTLPLVLGFAAGVAWEGRGIAQQAAPTQNEGITVPTNVSMDLGPEIDGMTGRKLRLRIVTVAPGGVFAVHNHKDRPTVEFVLGGSATEFRGTAEKAYKQGDAVLSDKDTTHWWRNDGSVPAVFIAADIFKPS